MANADALTVTGNAQHMVQHAASVARRTTGLSNVEALEGGTVHQDGHPFWEGQSCRDKEHTAASHSTKAGAEEEAVETRTVLPKEQVLDRDMKKESHTRLPPSQLLIFCQDHHALPK